MERLSVQQVRVGEMSFYSSVCQLATYANIYNCRSVGHSCWNLLLSVSWSVGELGVGQLTLYCTLGQLTLLVSLTVGQSVIGQSPLHRMKQSYFIRCFWNSHGNTQIRYFFTKVIKRPSLPCVWSVEKDKRKLNKLNNFLWCFIGMVDTNIISWYLVFLVSWFG